MSAAHLTLELDELIFEGLSEREAARVVELVGERLSQLAVSARAASEVHEVDKLELALAPLPRGGRVRVELIAEQLARLLESALPGSDDTRASQREEKQT